MREEFSWANRFKGRWNMKRKFSGKRLYALLKRVVIIVSVLAALWAVFSIYMYEVQFEKVFEHNEAVCERLYGDVKNESWGWSTYYYCLQVPIENFAFFEKSIVPSILAALCLPVIFFSASWFCRYLFPVQITETKPDGS